MLAAKRVGTQAPMALADDLSNRFLAVSLDRLSADAVAHVRTLLIDALACILAGARTEIARAALHTVADDVGTAGATIFPAGPQARAGAAAFANGTMLRSLDLMDVFVNADVSHPSESIPAALACAEASGATGRDFLETVYAALAMHAHLASTIPLHRNGLHHVGHAAWTVPLIAGRLMGMGPEASAAALNLSAGGLIVTEGFSRGHVANVKAMAFPLIARRAIETTELAASGVRAQAEACEEVIGLFARLSGRMIEPRALLPDFHTAPVESIALKAYPAQYALQPLIASGAAFHHRTPARVRDIANVVVRASRQTIARTADPAKFLPTSAEAADHSLPFCVASGLIDGGLTSEGLEQGRWRDPDILALIGCISVEPCGDDDGFSIGDQEIELRFCDGDVQRLPCRYPDETTSWDEIAAAKLKTAAGPGGDPDRVIEAIETIETEETIAKLIAAIGEAVKRPERAF